MLGIGWVVTLGMGQESGVREVIAQGHVQPALSEIFVQILLFYVFKDL